MSGIFVNYCLLLVAILLPMLVFSSASVPAFVLSVASFVAVGCLVGVALRLTVHASESRGELIDRHARLQKVVLLSLVVGGVAGSLRMFSYYEQFQLRFGVEVPLVVIGILAWVVSVAISVAGFVSTSWNLFGSLRRSD
ncbi:MAG: hypothetical protein GC150_04810 [Rhizobiales bacterium]|nr:hypothetical protein [Hyphomicrobiales bacterium]